MNKVVSRAFIASLLAFGVSGCATLPKENLHRPPGSGYPLVATASLFGVKSKAVRVCYVFDFEGELLSGLDTLICEIESSIGRLNPDQLPT